MGVLAMLKQAYAVGQNATPQFACTQSSTGKHFRSQPRA